MNAPTATHEIPRAQFFSLFLAVFAAAAGTQVLNPLHRVLEERYHVDPTTVAGLTAAYTLGYGIAGLFLGPLVKRIGTTRLLRRMLLVFACTNLVLYFGPPIAVFGALRVVSGAAAGAFFAALQVVIADAIPYERRGKALTLVMAGSFVAAILVMWASVSLSRFGLFSVFALIAACALAAFFLAPNGRSLADEPSHVPAAALTHDRRVVAALSITVLNTFAAFSVIGVFAEHLVDQLHATGSEREMFFLVLGLGTLPGVACAAFLSDRVGKHRMVAIALAASLALSPILAFSRSIGAFVVCAGVLAACSALRQGPFAALLSQLVDSHQRPRLLGWNGFASGVGIALGQVGGNFAYARAGFGAAVIVSAVALVGSLLLLRQVRVEDPSRRTVT